MFFRPIPEGKRREIRLNREPRSKTTMYGVKEGVPCRAVDAGNPYSRLPPGLHPGGSGLVSGLAPPGGTPSSTAKEIVKQILPTETY